MYYETYKKKDRRRRSRRSGGCLGWLVKKLFKLLALVLVLAILAAGALYALPVAVMNIQPADTDLSLNHSLPSNKVNVLLLGLDVLDDSSQRSDTMMIATLDYDSVKLTSVMRDTLVEIPGHGRQKINSAYSYGGPEMAMKCVNEAFGLNITNYVAVDFTTLVRIVDAVGGIEMEISDAELEQMNKNVGMSAWMFKPLGYDAVPMTQAGKVHLNGLFALGYARIRKIDSDYMRTYRQRKVISAVIDRMKGQLWNPVMYAKLFDVMQDAIQTNMSVFELVSLAEKAMFAKEMDTMRVPEDKHCEDNGSSIRITKPEEAKASLKAFLYN